MSLKNNKKVKALKKRYQELQKKSNIKLAVVVPVYVMFNGGIHADDEVLINRVNRQLSSLSSKEAKDLVKTSQKIDSDIILLADELGVQVYAIDDLVYI